jgi:hypothetical protein
MKILHDKYFTPHNIVELVIKRTKEVIGLDNISEFIEPSAGNGSFLNSLYELDKPIYAYDLYPERDDIIKQDYLKLEKDYIKNCCIIGNFPYGVKNTLSVQFYKKSITLGDYISCILPISQLNNNQQMYEFDLIHSEDLQPQLYSNVKVHCCLNIYKRNTNGLNEKPNYKLNAVTIKEVRSNLKLNPIKLQQLIDSGYKWDLRLLAWGTATNNRGVGSILNEDDKLYAKEFYVKINDEKNKEEIINIFKTTKWEEIYPQTNTPNLLQWQIYKYLKEKISHLE